MRFSRHVVYGLKRQFGKPIIVQRILSQSLNVETGIQDIETTTLRVAKAPVIPASEVLSKFTKLAEKGVVELSTLAVIIDKYDIRTWVLNTQDYIIIDDIQHVITSIFNDEYSYLLLVQKISAQPESQL